MASGSPGAVQNRGEAAIKGDFGDAPVFTRQSVSRPRKGRTHDHLAEGRSDGGAIFMDAANRTPQATGGISRRKSFLVAVTYHESADPVVRSFRHGFVATGKQQRTPQHIAEQIDQVIVLVRDKWVAERRHDAP